VVNSWEREGVLLLPTAVDREKVLSKGNRDSDIMRKKGEDY